MSRNKKIWYFIDIDGCIMPSIFPNDVFYKNDIEKLDIIVKAYQETKRLTYDNYNISFDVFESVLYPNFVEFFKEISKREDTNEINFVTGRQENIFGYLTNWQLKPLEKINSRFYPIYFPNVANHSKDTYKHFKISFITTELNFSEFKGEIKVYDDNDYYFEELKRTLNVDCSCYLAKNNDDWKILLENMKNEV